MQAENIYFSIVDATKMCTLLQMTDETYIQKVGTVVALAKAKVSKKKKNIERPPGLFRETSSSEPRKD